jgi:putative oxidoreductase
MKHIPTLARLLLGLIFVVFGVNMWLHFIPIPPPPEGPAKDFMFAIYGTGFLTVVKVLEVLGGLLLLSGRFTNLGLLLLGPVIVNIGMYHFFLVKGGYEMPALLGILSLVLLASRKSLIKAFLAGN